MFGHAPASVSQLPTSAIPFADPVAMDLLDANGRPNGSLGEFATAGLGATIPVIGVDTDDVGDVLNILGGIFGGHGESEPLILLRRNVGPSDRRVLDAIGVRVGEDGWWYSGSTKLSHDDADRELAKLEARMVGSTRQPSGFWTDDRDGHQLTAKEAFARWQQTYGAGATMEGALASGRTFNPTGVQLIPSGTVPAGSPASPKIAGFDSKTVLLVGALAIGATLLMRGRR